MVNIEGYSKMVDGFGYIYEKGQRNMRSRDKGRDLRIEGWFGFGAFILFLILICDNAHEWD